MKTNLQCIKCGCKRLCIIDKVMQPQVDTSNASHPLRVTAWYLGSGRGRRDVGHFEAIICTWCGYTELYARELAGLIEVAAIPDAGVRFVDSEPGTSGPYR